MRNASSSLLALVATGRYAIHLDVLVERAVDDETSVLQSYRSFGGTNWIVGVDFADSVDQNITSGTLRLARESDGLSLAPLLANSILNEDGTGAFSPALDVGREIEIRVAITGTMTVSATAPAAAGATSVSVAALAHPIVRGHTVAFTTGAGSGLTGAILSASAVAGATTLSVQPLAEAIGAGNNGTVKFGPDAAYNPAITTYAPGNWVPLFQGITGDPQWESNPLSVPFFSRLKVLADAFILDAFEVGSDVGTPVEVVVQEIVDRMTPGMFTVKTWPSSPGFLIRRGKIQPQSAYDAILGLVQQFGGRFAEKWDASTGRFELTIITPARDNTTPLYTLSPGPTEGAPYITVPDMKIDTSNLRTVVRGKAVDRATGQQITYQKPSAAIVAANPPTDPAIAKYGQIPMQLAEGSASQVDSLAELTAYVDAAHADLSTPTLLHSYEFLCLPWAELDDFVTLSANGVHYDEDQQGAVIGRSFSFSGGSGRTRLRFSDRAKGAYALWQLRSVELFGFNAVETGDPALLNLTAFGEVSGSRTATHVTLGWTPGAAVTSKFVYDVTLPVPITEEPRTALFASVPTILPVGTDSYTLEVPARGYKRFVLVVPRGTDLTPGRPQYWAQDAVDQPPYVSLTSQAQGSSMAVSDVSLYVSDPQGRGGTLYVWTNPSSPDSADTAQTPARLSLASTPTGITPFTPFDDLTFPLNNIQVHAGRGKRIFAQFVNDQGTSSAVESFQLQGYGVVEKPGGGLSDGVVQMASFASGIRPPRIVSVLPASGELVGDLALLTTDGLLYRWTGSAWTAAIPAANITGEIATGQVADGAISTAKFAAGLRPLEIVGALPSSGNTDGRLVFLTTDGKVYRYASGAWTATVAAPDITGQITGTQITDNAVTSPKIAADSIGAREIAALSITSAEIAANAIIAGKVQAGAISSTEIAASAITSDKVAAGAITVGKIAALSITSAEIASSAIIAAKIAADAITSDKIAANAITAGKLAVGAVGADQIAARAITAQHMLLTDRTNLAENGWFEDGTKRGWSDPLGLLTVISLTGETGVTAVYGATFAGVSGNAVSPVLRNIPVTVGKPFRMGGLAHKDTADWNMNLGALFYDRAGGFVGNQIAYTFSTATSGWQKGGGIITVPTGAAFMAPYIASAGGGTGGTWKFSEFEIREVANAELIVDGSITAQKISSAQFWNQDTNPTAVIRLRDTVAIPGTATRYIDLAATGTGSILQHPALALKADGTAAFSGALSAATGTFTGSLTLEQTSGNAINFYNSGTLTVSQKTGIISTFPASVFEFASGDYVAFYNKNTGPGVDRVAFLDMQAGTKNARIALDDSNRLLVSTPEVILDVQRLGFYGTPGIVRPSVTGSRSSNAALASLLTALHNAGLILNNTT